MNVRHSTTALSVTIGLLAIGGVASILIGVYPGALLLVGALALTGAQRTALARAIRTPDASVRRRRLRAAAVLAVVFAASVASYARDIRDDHISDTSLLVHNGVGVPALIGAVLLLVIGLLTPRVRQLA